MPGYEPFLLCDFHVHTRWSDGALSVARGGGPLRPDRQVRRDRDHRSHPDEEGPAGRASGGWPRSAGARFGIREDEFEAYLDDIDAEGAARAARIRDAGASRAPRSRRTGSTAGRTRTSSRSTSSSTSAPTRRPTSILREIRRQGALSIACHPHHRTTRRIEISTCYLWDNRKTLADLVDVWEAANRDDLFSVTSLKHYPYVANSDFHKPKHLYSWKTLLRCEKTCDEIKEALRRNVDVALTLFRKGDWVGGAA